MTQSSVIVARDGDILVITLNQPERLNALSVSMMTEAIDAVDRAAATGVRALVLTGAGRAFCSGADLQSEVGEEIGPLHDTVNRFLERLAALPLPVVVAVNGPAAGAGAGLAIAGDFTLMARSAYLLLAFVNIGLVPDAGVSFLLPRLIGRQRAIEMMMLGERVGAEKAEGWGLIHKAIDDDKLMDETLTLARRLATGPTRSYGLMRGTMRKSLDATYTETLGFEREAQQEASSTQDFAEGLKAFEEKRKPVFKGR